MSTAFCFKKGLKKIALASLLSCPVGAARADWSVRSSVELSPQLRKLNQHGFGNENDVTDTFALATSHLEWSEGNWFVEIKPEVRAVMSKGILASVPTGVSAQTTRRLLNARRTLVHDSGNPGSEASFDFDRINFRHQFGSGEWYLGRKPLSLGVLRFFPVWNKLTLPLIFQPGPEWIENPDVLGVLSQSNSMTYHLFASRNGEPSVDDLALMTARHVREGYELQFLLGSWWLRSAAGVAGAFDSHSATLRFESIWVSQYANETAQAQIGLGFERALDEKWTMVAEALYQTAGLDDLGNSTAPPSRFMSLSGRTYFLPQLSYQIHPLWQLRAGVLTGFAKSSSAIAMGGFEHSMSDNTTLTLKVKLPFGAEKGEFGPERVTAPFGRKLGMSSSALLQLQSTF
jgi:hypothetical protein